MKKSIIRRERKRQKAVQKFYLLRLRYKKFMNKTQLLLKRIRIHGDMQKFSRNSRSSRIRNRCIASSRSRSYYRRFGLSRHFFRVLVNQGFFPGLKKYSW